MKKIQFWIVILVFLVSLVFTGAVLADNSAQDLPPGVESETPPSIEGANPDIVSLGYAFSQNLGTFTPITGGTVHGNASNDDTSFPAIDIGFPFTYNAAAYTQVSIQSNGFIAMGPTISSSYTPLSTGSSNNVIAVLGRDIEGNDTTSELMSLMEGTAPNRVFTIQWLHYRRYGSTYTGDDFNFQIKIYETSNLVEVVYGSFAFHDATTLYLQVGLRGNSNADFNNRTTSTDWTASTAGVSNTDTMSLSSTVYPPSGLIFDWTVQPYVALDPDYSVSACRGSSIDYPLTALNGTSVTDTLDIAASGFAWPTTVDPTSLTLGPNASGGVNASVHIPWAAPLGGQDVATLTATGQNSGLSDTATLVTSAAIVSGYADYSNAPVGREVRAPSVVYWAGKLYKIGGYNVSAQPWLDIYDIATDSWTTGADMPGGRYWLDCEAIDLTGTDPKIYCAGGYSTSGQTTLYIYDINTNAWTSGAALSSYRYSYASVAYNNLYYIVGGYGAAYQPTLWVYNPATNVWDYTLASMTTGRRYHSAGVIGGKIYVAGGYSPSYLSSVEVYDIAANSWSAGPSMPISWLNAADGVLYDRYLVLAGGDDNSTATSSSLAWILDTVTGTWSALPNMVHQLYGAEGDGDGSSFWIASGRLYDGAYSYSPYTTLMLQCDTTCTPVSGLDFTWDPMEPWANYPATFSAFVTGGSPAITYDWDFGDGNTGSGQEVVHTYANTGIYVVTVTATNCDGANYVVATHNVTVILPPTISVDPLSLHAIQQTNQVTTQTLEICNLGDYPLTWELAEAEAGLIEVMPHSAPAVQASPQPEIMRLPDGSVDCAAYQNYAGFEPAEVAAACPVSLPQNLAAGLLAPTDTGYALDIGYISDNFVSFPLNNFTGQTVIGTNATPFYGMDFDPAAEVLWALNDTTDQLGTIDLATGAFTGLVSSPPPVDIWTGLSIHPVTGDFYASDATSLYTIDPATGNSSLIGAFGTPTLMIDIAINSDGQMYGHDIGTDSIYSIDMTTGAATLIGLTGQAANYAQGLDFDNDDGTLYIFLYIGSGANVYGTVDLATGWVTPLAVSAPQGEFEGAVKTPGFVYDIPWVSENPITGTIPGGGCNLLDVVFDSTGMAIGDYFGNFEITSNDPAAPLTTVPVNLTVIGLPDIEVNMPVLDVELPPDATTTLDGTICNVGDFPLNWAITEIPSSLLGSQNVVPAGPPPVGSLDSAPTHKDIDMAPAEPDALGDLLFEVDFGAVTGDTQLLGVEFDGMYYWVTGGNSGLDPNKLYKIDTSGALIATYDQASDAGWGWRDLAYDGTYLYASDSAVIEEIDPATGLATGVTIPSPINPARALAYDPVMDHFWAANWDSSLYEFDRTGTIINAFPAVGLSTYGMAWDSFSAGGPFLWLWSQDGPDPLLMASQVNPITGALTGVSFLGSGVVGEMAGGAAITDQLVPGYAVFLGMNQGVSDRVGVYELVAGLVNDIPWLSEDPLSGTLGAGECIDEAVTFDSTGLANGVYTGDLLVASDDPDEPEITLPVTLTVVPMVDFVYYDLEDVVLPGEAVYLAGSFTNWLTDSLPMTPNGDYSAFTVTVLLAPDTYEYKYVVYTDTVPTGPAHYDWLQSYPDGSNRMVEVIDSMMVEDYRDIVPGWYILQGPPETTTTVHIPTESIYGLLWAWGLTNEDGVPPELLAELGYGTQDDPSAWSTWTAMPWISQEGDYDQYANTITPDDVGVFSYAVRFNGNWGVGNPNNMWYYGDTNGNVYDPVEAGVLTVIGPTIELVKTVGTDPNVCAATDTIEVLAGTEVFYCYSVTNTSLIQLEVHDLVDDQLGNLLVDYPFALVPGESTFITASAVITEDVVNSATWTAGDGDTHFAESSDTAAVTVSTADLSLTKTGPSLVETGDTFTYTLTVENLGPDAAVDVVLVDTLPDGVTFVSATAPCTEASGVVTCELGEIAFEGVVEIEIVVMAPDVVGTITNDAMVSSGAFDPDETNNTATLDTVVEVGVYLTFLPMTFK